MPATKNRSSFRSVRISANPFSLLARAYLNGNDKECMDLLGGIYCFLTHKSPPRSLKNRWKKEILGARKIKNCAGLDFLMQQVSKMRSYWLRLFLHDHASPDCYLAYCNGAHMTDLCRDVPIVRRANQLMVSTITMKPESKKAS